MHSANPPLACLPQSFLLSITDDLIRVFQNLITILNSYYESSLSNPDMNTSLDFIKLACDDLHRYLAVLWPCEQQYVAVLGCTGCGKSTLLNLLLSMMCSYGSAYTHGIKADSFRAVLRDSARVCAGNAKNLHHRINSHDEDASENSEVLLVKMDERTQYISNDILSQEQASLEGVLGICCAQDRHSYMSEHIPQYDRHPFILRNGRMGDAGTTKVTSVVYGPKFVGHIRWMTRKKMRRKLRDLRQMLDSADQLAPVEEQLLSELKEFWYCVQQIVNLPLNAERPTEEQINMVINDLGNKRRLLDKEERIETIATVRSTVDRVYVREGIKEKLDQQFGKLVEDLRIEVPISSFEGGISLLDVPGTNDPRVLHQRETRDAIDRTSLILLVLDKSVMDNQTQSALAESPLLEKMLTDESAGCSLVVVAIAEKNTQRGQSPKDVLANFDSKENVLRTLKKVFQKSASRLCKSKRIEKEHALNRIEELFTTSITLIPVLPFLCASLHLSPSNPSLHQRFCQSRGKSSCPLKMTEEELRERCKETNIPYLLEKLHSVRVPPTQDDLNKFMDSAIDGLRPLTTQSMVDNSYVEFLKAEQVQACSISHEEVIFVQEPVHVDIKNCLLQSAADCKVESIDIRELCETVGDDLLNQLQAGRFSYGPFILRGFCPEVIGNTANSLLSLVDKESKLFTDKAYNYLFSLRGGPAYLEARFSQVGDSMPLALGLHEQLNSKWKLSLNRLRAKCFCGGVDGGLLSQVRGALRKAYDAALKHLLKELKQRKTRDFCAALTVVLEKNILGLHAAKVAEVEVNKALNRFWENLFQSTNVEMQFLWKAWQTDIVNLAKSAQEMLEIQEKRGKNLYMVDNQKGEFSLFQEQLREKEKELKALKSQLGGSASQVQDTFKYGYGLLRSDSTVDMIIDHEQQQGSANCLSPVNERAFAQKFSVQTNTKISDKERSSLCVDDGGVCEEVLPAGILESLHGSDKASKKGIQLGCVDSHQKPLGSTTYAMHINRLGSFLNRSSRKARILSDAEAVSLQKRESSAKRLKK